ncbi:hypothetical protein A2U01_0107227, partial [Trifolium medium]|nr:hypothetical protein [Trifolium medium]
MVLSPTQNSQKFIINFYRRNSGVNLTVLSGVRSAKDRIGNT